MPRRPVLEFWYEFASTYSYLSAMRIEEVAEHTAADEVMVTTNVHDHGERLRSYGDVYIDDAAPPCYRW